MVYIVAVDRELINDDYILFAQIIMSAVFFITMIITVHRAVYVSFHFYYDLAFWVININPASKEPS